MSLATRVATRIIHANNDASLICDTRGYTPLSLAISLARPDRTLCTEFASVLIRESDPAALSTEDDGGNTPIHIAVSVGNARLTRELLIRGSYGASWNHDGEAPIHIVAKSGNSKLLKVGSSLPPPLLENIHSQRFCAGTRRGRMSSEPTHRVR